MLTDYLGPSRAAPPSIPAPIPPPTFTEDPPFAVFFEDRLGRGWLERRPVYRPGIAKEDLKRLLDMLLHLENAIADIPPRNLNISQTENLLLESARLLPETLHALYRHADYALNYAWADLGSSDKVVFSIYGLRAFSDPFGEQTKTTRVLYHKGLVSRQRAFLNPVFSTKGKENSFRYLLACAVGVHSGMSWAADCLSGHTPEELQAALLLCPTPYRHDWRTCPLETMFTDYYAAWCRENDISDRRMSSIPQAELHYGRRHRGEALKRFLAFACNLLERFKLKPKAFQWNMLLKNSLTASYSVNVLFIWSPYALGMLVMALRSTLEQRRHSQTPLSVSPPLGKRYLPLSVIEASPWTMPHPPGLFRSVFHSEQAARLGFPEAIGALRITNQGNLFIPFIPVTDRSTQFKILLFPSTETALELLHNLYGLPRPSPLLRLPTRLEALAAVSSPKYGQTLSEVFPSSLYGGRRDIRPLLRQAGEDQEERHEDECPPTDLFHALLFKP